MTYEEAEEEFRRELPKLQERDPPTPRRLLGFLVDLERKLQEFDVSAIGRAKRRARATPQELTDATKSLQSALGEFLSQLEGETQ